MTNMEAKNSADRIKVRIVPAKFANGTFGLDRWWLQAVTSLQGMFAKLVNPKALMGQSA